MIHGNMFTKCLLRACIVYMLFVSEWSSVVGVCPWWTQASYVGQESCRPAHACTPGRALIYSPQILGFLAPNHWSIHPIFWASSLLTSVGLWSIHPIFWASSLLTFVGLWSIHPIFWASSLLTFVGHWSIHTIFWASSLLTFVGLDLFTPSSGLPRSSPL